MGRFDDLMKKMGEVADPQIQPGDEAAVANNPRNWLTGNVNKVLPDSLQIPAQTVADDKMAMQKMPETMAAGTMGTIKNAGPMGALSHAEIMAHPEMKAFLEPAAKAKFRSENPFASQYDLAKQALINKLQQQGK